LFFFFFVFFLFLFFEVDITVIDTVERVHVVCF
jgi:hypothetical protein